MGYDPTIPDRKPRLSDEAIEIAVSWLEANEGDGDESDACHRVASWLKIELNNREASRLAKACGAKPRQVREAVAAKMNREHGNEP